MRLSAENRLLLVAAKKGWVSADNQPDFREKSFLAVMKRFQISQLVRPDLPGPNGERRFKLTNYGTLGAVFFSMLDSCPEELRLGDFRWHLMKD